MTIPTPSQPPSGQTTARDATVRDACEVTVTRPVDGRPNRVTRGPDRRPRSGPVETLTVDPRVMAQAHAVIRPGEHLVIDNEECVHTEYDT
jgi:hypothetical protein